MVVIDLGTAISNKEPEKVQACTMLWRPPEVGHLGLELHNVRIWSPNHGPSNNWPVSSSLPSLTHLVYVLKEAKHSIHYTNSAPNLRNLMVTEFQTVGFASPIWSFDIFSAGVTVLGAAAMPHVQISIFPSWPG